MAAYDWRAIAQIFNQSLLKRLAQNRGLDVLTRVAFHSPLDLSWQQLSIGEVLDRLYELLTIHYRSEYVYKNAVAKKISIERHIHRQSRLITEFRVNQSKADTVILNGTSTVYEIKTELDDLARLERQLNDYNNVFDKIFVVTHVGGSGKVLETVPDHVGVITLNDSFGLDVLRDAISNVDNVNPLVIFDSLRRAEYLNILSKKFGFTPPSNKFDVYHKAREQFAKLSPIEAHAGMLAELKARTSHPSFMSFVEKLPQSLRAIGLASELSRKHQDEVVRTLSQSIQFIG